MIGAQELRAAEPVTMALGLKQCGMLVALIALAGLSSACFESTAPSNAGVRDAIGIGREGESVEPAAVLLVIDESSIDNGNPPNSFSDTEVNDQLARVGQRRPLRYFQDNVGVTIELFTGEVDDEGWFALKAIPSSWRGAGPTDNGAQNYLVAGPGLGARFPDDDREVLLDKIPDVTPLRATGLAMLVGQTVCAVVYDSDVGLNYSPLNGNLMGANLGVVAFDVLEVWERTDASTSSLPGVTILIRDADEVCAGPLLLFANAPVPRSSSEPFDVELPGSISSPVFESAP